MYYRVISLEIQVGITSHRNKMGQHLLGYWPCQRWNQVPRKTNDPLPTGHTHSDIIFMIMNAEVSVM
jgi:hypothetical protein